MRGPFNGPENFAWKVITKRWSPSRRGKRATNRNYASMERFSIQEIKLLSSFELCEIKRAICRMILASFESYKRETPSCTVLISFSALPRRSLTPSVGTDGKDKIGYFQDDDLIRNSNIRETSERSKGERQSSRPSISGVSLGAGIKHLRKRRRSQGFNGGARCVCLWKADAFMLIRHDRLQPRMEVTFSETEYMHIQAHVAGADGHLLN